jgi:hypothetical protein
MNHFLDDKLEAVSSIWKYSCHSTQRRCLVRLSINVTYSLNTGHIPLKSERGQWPINLKTKWPRGLRPDPSLPSRTLGLWVRIPLEAYMFVYIYSVFVLSCVGSELAAG